MTNLKIVAAPADRLGELHAERAAACKQLAENAGVLVRVDEFDRKAAAVKNEVEGLAERETAMLRDWTVAGCRGPAPAPLAEERAAAVKRLVDAQAASEPGPRTRSEIDRQNSELAARIADIDNEVEVLILDALETKFHARCEALRKSMAAARANFADALGYRGALLARARSLVEKGRNDEATPLFQRVERLGIPGNDVDVTPTNKEIEAATTVALCYEGGLRAGGSK